MRIDVTVMPSGAPPSPDTVHEIRVDLAGVSSDVAFFDALARELDLPDYFGRNWAALDECLSDYVVVENGGLGSEFGGRQGIHAERVRMVFLRAGDERLLGRFLDVLDYVREVNEHRRAVDLDVVFQVDGRTEADALGREVARRRRIG